MRILITNLLAVAVLLFSAASASAYAYTMTSNYDGVTPLTTSDTVQISVYLDADVVGTQLVGVGVLYPGDGTITYDEAATGLLPGSGQPGYILYSPASGMLAGMIPAAILYPQQTPFTNWPAPPPGQGQVNVNYAEPGFNPSQATGNGIWLATLVFHIEAGFEGGSIDLCTTCGGNIIQSDGAIVAPGSIGVSGSPVVLVGASVPEPTTAMLIGLGVLGLAVAGRRRA